MLFVYLDIVDGISGTRVAALLAVVFHLYSR